jgi:hypothetical protein
MPTTDGRRAPHSECSTPERRQPAEHSKQSPDELIVVADKPDLKKLAELLLSPERALPVVGLTPSLGSVEPPLSFRDLHAITGQDVPVYFLGPPFAAQLQHTLTQKLAVPRGASRIWWPGLSRRSDPRDHPVVRELEGEHEDSMLLEFARQYDLSRPHVRRELKIIDGALAVAEQKLTEAADEQRHTAEQLRNTQIELHDALSLAAVAELRLTVTLQKLGGANRVERPADTPPSRPRCRQE